MFTDGQIGSIWHEYPRKRSKHLGVKAIATALQRLRRRSEIGECFEWLKSKTLYYARWRHWEQSCGRDDEQFRFTPYAQRWYGQAMYDEEIPKVPDAPSALIVVADDRPPPLPRYGSIEETRMRFVGEQAAWKKNCDEVAEYLQWFSTLDGASRAAFVADVDRINADQLAKNTFINRDPQHAGFYRAFCIGLWKQTVRTQAGVLRLIDVPIREDLF